MELSDSSLDKLASRSGISKEMLTKKVNEKYNEFSGLVTREGAFYIAMKELGIEMENDTKIVKMRDITPDLRKINLVGKVFKISPITEFVKSNGNKGKVVNIYLSDGTGYAKMLLWDDQVASVQDGMIIPGSVLQISNATSKENPFGELEIVLGKFGNLKLIDNNYNLPKHEELFERFFRNIRRTLIKDLTPGNVEISGIILQVFKSKFLFNTDDGEDFMVVNCVIDDGTGTIRVVFFRDLAENLSGLKPDDLKNLDAEARYKIMDKNLLGKEVLIQGRVNKNMNFDRLEMTANKITNLNVLEESKKLIDSIETAVGA